MRLILFFVTITAVIIYTVIFGIIITKNFVFDGLVTYTYDFEYESPFISLLKPRGRVDQQLYKDTFGDYYQTIKIDPVYFDIELPRHFDSLNVQLKYKNPFQPLLELGISRGEDDPNFNLKPVENKLLDKIIENPQWSMVQEGNILLLQKGSQYNKIQDFIDNIPADGKIATYNYDLPMNFNIPNYSSQNGVIINKSLRGSHTMSTYLGSDENLDITFNFHDMNRGNNKDDIKVEVSKNDAEIFTTTLNDDGIEDNSAFMSVPFDYHLKLDQPGAGVYKIKIQTTDDIFIRQINSQHDYLVFQGAIYLGDNVSYLNDKTPNRTKATTLYTTSERANAITSHIEGYQDITFDTEKFSIDEKHILFTKTIPLSQRNEWLTQIHSPQNDVKLIGDGLFAFEKKHFFDPHYLEISGDPDLDLDFFNVKYIIATYHPPQKRGDWYVQNLKFDLEKIRDADNEYRFVISFPYAQDKETIIDISEISLSLKSEPINMHIFFNKILNRLKMLGLNL